MYNKRIASLLLEKLQIENKRINEISKNLIHKLIDSLLGYDITVDRVQDVTKAFVNKGGISTKELSPKTMEAKRYLICTLLAKRWICMDQLVVIILQ